MSSTRRIYVDMDDVLCQTALAFVEVLNRDFGRGAQIEQITTFDLSKSFDLTADQHQAFMDAAHKEEVLQAVLPMPGANEVLHRWVDQGYEIEVVTGRPPTTEEVSARWLEEAGVPHRGLTFVDKYSRVLPGWDGGSVVRLEDLDASDFLIAIEDSWHAARLLADDLGMTVLLLDRPWNREAEPVETRGPGRVLRCRDWQEIEGRFSAL